MNHPILRNSSLRLLAGAFITFKLLIASSTAWASLVADWDFNSYNGSATTLAADSGNGTLAFASFSGDTGSYTGTTLNALPGVPAGSDLAVKDEAHNGSSLTFQFDGSGFSDFVISYAAKRSSTGFNTQTWAYSLDDKSFSDFASLGFSQDSDFELKTVDFSSITALSNQPDIYFRVTLTGASRASGNNRFDNIQINADQAIQAVPEAKSTGFLTAAFLVAVFIGEQGFRKKGKHCNRTKL